ncbi:MAG: asparagine synthase-related protein [Coriobacteriia bacterium]|nr:asparagine synthase-related protein [Coriobacteriia bacterium]
MNTSNQRPHLSPEILEPLQHLGAYFLELPTDMPVVVALSGGVDSSVVGAVARRVLGPARVTAVFFDMPIMVEDDRLFAEQIAEVAKLDLEIITFDPLIIDAVRYNRTDRCYQCKNALFSILQENYAGAFICDGTNIDDDPQRRPGMKALTELGIHSPLRDCNISKEQVRLIARGLGLPNADRESSACLATQYPADTELAL